MARVLRDHNSARPRKRTRQRGHTSGGGAFRRSGRSQGGGSAASPALLRGWEPIIPAVPGPLSPAVILPTFGAEIPHTLRFGSTTPALTELADALRQEKIIRPGDWTGNLVETIEQGIQRWYFQEMGMGQNRFMRLDLLYTDDTNGDQDDDGNYHLMEGYKSGNWEKHWGRDGAEDSQIGMFALGCGSPERGDEIYGQNLFVGARVAELNALATGAGYSVFGLIRDSLGRVVQTADPKWGAHVLDYTGGFRSIEADDPGYSEPSGGYYFGTPQYSDKQREAIFTRTKQRYRAKFPRGVWTAKWKPAPVRKALRQNPRHELREILEAALDLGALWESFESHADERLKYPNEWDTWNTDGEELTHPIILRWHKDDQLGRVYDEYMQCAMENAGFTTIIFKRGFQTDHPESIRVCLAGLKTAVEVITRGDRLLSMLHQSPEEQVRVEVRI